MPIRKPTTALDEIIDDADFSDLDFGHGDGDGQTDPAVAFAEVLIDGAGIWAGELRAADQRVIAALIITSGQGWQLSIGDALQNRWQERKNKQARAKRMVRVNSGGTDIRLLDNAGLLIWTTGKPLNAKEAVDTLPDRLVDGMSIVAIAPSERMIPASVRHAADLRLSLPPLSSTMVSKAIARLSGRKPKVTMAQADAARLTPAIIRACWRPWGTADQYVARMTAAVRASAPAASGLRLAALIGMDEAADWGRAVAQDLADLRAGRITWEDCDRGALLSGPPGTGKTTYAKALSAECGVPLVTGSHSQWQAAGHLGELLKAMRETFEQARQQAPCILFIDELDGFGDRSSVAGDYRDYALQVINGLLEELDGVAGREGVVVVGACNDPSRIDPAIMRSGRIEKHLSIPLPDHAALAMIFKHYGQENWSEAAYEEMALNAIGATGADVEKWCRGARRRARSARRPMTEADVMAEICGQDERTEAELRRIAVHEAGHAVMAELTRAGSVLGASIRGGEGRGGHVAMQPHKEAIRTKATLLADARVLLAGRAAEEVLLGDVSSGAGGGQQSDLAKASVMLVNGLAAHGLDGGAPLWTGPVRPEAMAQLMARRPALAREAEALLAEAYAESKATLERQVHALQAVSDALLVRKSLLGDEISALVTPDSNAVAKAPAVRLAAAG
jgi:cell division protease FtsH